MAADGLAGDVRLQADEVDPGRDLEDALDDAVLGEAQRLADAGEDGVEDALAHRPGEIVGGRGRAAADDGERVGDRHVADRIVDDRRRPLGAFLARPR